MLLYTKEPYELIFGDAKAGVADITQPVLKKVNGVLVEGCEQTDGFHVSRLYSTNPRHYLDPGYSPGSIIKHTQE